MTVTSHGFLCKYDSSSESSPNFGQSVPIGVGLQNTSGFILNESMSPAAIGVVGELYCGGPKVAREYIGQPDLTNGSFVGTSVGLGRLYKTGDRVRWLNSGDVEFLGRVDFQIKLNGQRIETSEIEAVLRQVEGVRDALVVLQQSSAGLKRLVAYTVPAVTDPAAVIRISKLQLPHFMVPAVVIALDQWPLNASGKVDRHQLPAPQWDAQPDKELVEPRSATEQCIANAVLQVLQVESVSIMSDLLSLGLTSLLAVHVSSNITNQDSTLRVSSASIMQHRTIENIAKVAVVPDTQQAQPPLVRQEFTNSKTGWRLSYEQ